MRIHSSFPPVLISLAATLSLLPICAAAATPPSIDHIITASGFGGYAGVAAPGSWIEIYGANLAGTTRTWATADFTGSAAPTSLDGVTVTINGTPGFISYVSPSQINLQLPDGLATGTATVVAGFQGLQSAGASLTIQPQKPGRCPCVHDLLPPEAERPRELPCSPCLPR